MCFTPNICLLKSCRGHDLMIGFNRRIDSHEKYDPNTKKLNNIALIELMSEIKPEVESSYYTIKGICLSKEQILNDLEEEALFSGWGNIDPEGEVENIFLKKVNYKIKSHKDCYT